MKRQAQLLDISRGSAYYRPRPVSERDLALMRRIDELHLEHPFAGSRLLSGLQGSQFTSLEFTDTLRRHGIAISMDGRGCWRDNVFVERLWKSIKYEDVYLKAYETVSAVRAGLATYIDFYNTRRPHSAHGGCTPEVAYYATLPTSRLAA